MYDGARVAVIMPAYNAAKTIRDAYDEVIAQGVVDLIVIVDDCSKDDTESIVRSLPTQTPELVYLRHPENRGYGGNQKSCYKMALEHGATMYLSTENVKKSLLWLSPPVLKWFLTETDLSTLLRG